MIAKHEATESVRGVIEVLNRSGQVLQRVPFTGGELSVGRAYDNDIIVGDPYVCPHHLSIAEVDGALVFYDQGSINGSYRGKERNRIEQGELGEGALIHIGHSQLRFRRSGSPVAATWLDTAHHGLLAWFDKPWMLVLALFLVLLVMTGENIMDSSEKLRLGELAGQLLYPLIGILVWAGFWSLINRVLAHRANFPIHLAISCIGLAALLLSSELFSIAGFAFAWDPAVPWLRLAGRILILALVVFTHLRYATHGRPRMQVVVAGLVGILLFGAPAVGTILDRDKFNTLPYLDPLLKPPVLQLKKGESVESFFSGAATLKSAVDEDSSEDRSSNGDE